MRIISGKYKGRLFNPPKNLKARPTTDFAKENLFNILSLQLDWEDVRAIDFFAGTGSISYELISRGCEKVVAIEKNSVHTNFMKSVKRELDIKNLTIFNTDFYVAITKFKEQFNFIFADPPYDLENFDQIPTTILNSNCLSSEGLFVLEHSADYDFSEIPEFVERRNYGSVNFSFFSSLEEEVDIKS